MKTISPYHRFIIPLAFFSMLLVCSARAQFSGGDGRGDHSVFLYMEPEEDPGPVTVNVWPGDTRNNGRVASSDIIPIGIYYNEQISDQGPEDNNPGTSWNPRERQTWPADEGKPARVYADANGDGVIDVDDVLVIGFNYGKTSENPDPAGDPIHDALASGYKGSRNEMTGSGHSKSAPPDDRSVSQEQILSGVAGLNLVEDLSFEGTGEGLLRLTVSAESPLPLQGVAFRFQLHSHSDDPDESLLAHGVERSSSSLGDDLLVFSKYLEEENRIDFAVTRTGRHDQFAGSDQDKAPGPDGVLSLDELARLEIRHAYSAETEVLLSLDRVRALSQDGRYISMQSDTLKLVIGGSVETGLPHDEIPETFALYPNYPNPFNPSTQIRFALPEQAHVRLSVYNVLGQQVATLVNETRNAGWHDVTFDASGLSSGVFLYRLEADRQVQTRQMMYVK